MMIMPRTMELVISEEEEEEQEESRSSSRKRFGFSRVGSETMSSVTRTLLAFEGLLFWT